jgi:4-phospho-D-threonate 3-dehydrogenase / 4-phospho-D-erythronate 3-dehydrogenase
MFKPIIGITMGDAAGIGPEIIVKALAHQTVYDKCRPIVIGDKRVLEAARILLKREDLINSIHDLSSAGLKIGEIDCFDLDILSTALPYGRVSPIAGGAAYRYIEEAVSLATGNRIDAICTAPINKEALNMAGYPYPGHTEILAKLTNTQDFRMMFYSPRLRVILVTVHIGIIDAIHMINPDLVLKTILLASEALEEEGIASPKVGVCAINPHAGEGGMFGYREEENKIIPAVEFARKNNMDVIGPLPADTIFYRALRGDFDIVVSMYHDQGLIPLKTMGLDLGINITVGLPIIRTSVDHGTAFDIAGLGIADESNMIAAIIKAADYACAKRNRNTTDNHNQAEGVKYE